MENQEKLKLLCFCIYRGGGITRDDIKLYSKLEGRKVAEINKLCDKMVSEGLIDANSNYWFTGILYSVPSHVLISYYLSFCKENPNWISHFKTCLPEKQDNFMVALDCVLKGEWDKISSSVFDDTNVLYLIRVIDKDEFRKFALNIPEYLFGHFFDKALCYYLENDLPDYFDYLLGLLNDYKLLTESQKDIFYSQIHLYRYYSCGEYEPLKNPSNLYDWILEAVHSAHQSDYVKALYCFEKALKLRNKISKEKNVLLGVLNAYFMVLTYVHLLSEGGLKKLEVLQKKESVNVMESLLPAKILIEYVLSTPHKIYVMDVNNLINSNTPVLKWMGFFFGLFFKLPKYELLPVEIFQPKLAVLRHEMASVLQISDEEKQELDEKFGKSLLASLNFKADWEYLIDDILNMEKGKVTRDVKERLMYLIHPYGEVDVRIQNVLKSGAWGAGKHVSSYRLFNEDLDMMDETDKRICHRWKNSGLYSLEITEVLPELVGSDRVYTGRNAPFMQVNVTEEKPYLIIEKEKSGFIVQANYQMIDSCDRAESDTHLIVKKNELNYVVFPLDKTLKMFYSKLLAQKRFPLEAETKLKELIKVIGGKVNIHSSLVEEGSIVEVVEGNAGIGLQVKTYEAFFQINFCVKPSPNGNLTFRPGQGLAIVFDETAQGRCKIKRHLKTEKSNYDSIVFFIEETCGVQVEDYGVELNLKQMLNVLEYIQTVKDTYYIEWIDGQQLKLKNMVQSKEWNIQLKSDHEWFEIEGDVKLDDNTLVSVAQLLDLIGNNNERFVRLSDGDFLILSDNLRKQLSRIEAIAVRKKGKARIAAIQAGMLADDILGGELGIQSNEALDKLRDKIAKGGTVSVKVPAGLNATMRDYQVEGFKWIAKLNNWGAGACLADDMGLGKTLQSIAYLLLKSKQGPSLVVAPASVVPNWEREVRKFAPVLNTYMLNTSSDRKSMVEKAKANDVILATYGLLVSETDAILSRKWNVVCLDEAHAIKNRETKTSAVVMQLNADNKIILTGTPIQNHLGELWNLFQFINPGLLGGYDQFQQKFILPIEQGKDKQRQLLLNKIVHPFMLRRTKQEVVEELPDKEEIVLPVELSEEEMGIYEMIRIRAKQMVEDGGANVNAVTLSEITKLRQAACCASLTEKKWKGKCSKIEALIGLLNDLREGNNRALIFSQFTSFFLLVKKQLDEAGIPYLYLDGTIPMKKREKLVSEFQEGECPFFLISLKAGGLGLNLTGANYVIHLDPWWNPAIEQQATDRAYRIGQKQKVIAYHLVSAHTIEEKILRMHNTKRNLSDALLDGTDMSHKLNAKDLIEILNNKFEED